MLAGCVRSSKLGSLERQAFVDSSSTALGAWAI